MSSRPSDATPEVLLSEFPSEVQAIAAPLRALLRRCVPQAEERATPGWRTLNWRDPCVRKGGRQFLYVALYEDRVHLGFDDGVLLDDPAKLLRGTAQRARWVRLESPSDVQRLAKPLRGLVQQAVALGRLAP